MNKQIRNVEEIIDSNVNKLTRFTNFDTLDKGSNMPKISGVFSKNENLCMHTSLIINNDNYNSINILGNNSNNNDDLLIQKKINNMHSDEYYEEIIKNSQILVVIATPGKLLKIINLQRNKFSNIQFLILDEADKLLNLGFQNIIEKIVSYLPKQRKTGLFTATLDQAVTKLSKLSLRNPEKIVVNSQLIPAKLHLTYLILKPFQKLQFLLDFISVKGRIRIVFFSSCAAVDYFYVLAKKYISKNGSLNKSDFYTSDTQNQNKNYKQKCAITDSSNKKFKNDEFSIEKTNNCEYISKKSVSCDLNESVRNNENDKNIKKNNNENVENNENVGNVNKYQNSYAKNEMQKYNKNQTEVTLKNTITHQLNFYKVHGRIENEERQRAYENFSNNGDVLFCTDLAARGIDFEKVDDVIHFDAPLDPSNFVHRSGRTARNGKIGRSILLLLENENAFLDYLKIKGVNINEYDENATSLRKNLDCSLQNCKTLDLFNRKKPSIEDENCECKSNFCNNVSENNADGTKNSNIFEKNALKSDNQKNNKKNQIIENKNLLNKDLVSIEKNQKPSPLNDNYAQENFTITNYTRSKLLSYNELKSLFDENLTKLSLLAFISFIRSYKEYSLSYIFKLKELNFNSTAALFFIEKIPQMNELQNVVFKRFPRSKNKIIDSKHKKKFKSHDTYQKKIRLERIAKKPYKSMCKKNK
ncbi:hypothetical protein EDEG_01490 [Edhazardia aedis USNM 41457]|uniref:ATP-dependent RNA helicase n=1 Tax=Edhazardia aedis (strain USNM 41457) TaxID=1003232 RepID=J9D8Y2_EDHAE|nr:hypothetical protein EDEG_01490 [Edhazardia aedis USNM 41457]|eukprot:EJW04221.1 hypothetical protein EDEG_01490 [Edhazardia aedis USNM 41457]